MKDDIFWGNLKGILKRGKWEVSLEEASALVAIYQEAIRRSEPIKPQEIDPIKPIHRKKKGETP